MGYRKKGSQSLLHQVNDSHVVAETIRAIDNIGRNPFYIRSMIHTGAEKLIVIVEKYHIRRNPFYIRSMIHTLKK